MTRNTDDGSNHVLRCNRRKQQSKRKTVYRFGGVKMWLISQLQSHLRANGGEKGNPDVDRRYVLRQGEHHVAEHHAVQPCNSTKRSSERARGKDSAGAGMPSTQCRRLHPSVPPTRIGEKRHRVGVPSGSSWRHFLLNSSSGSPALDRKKRNTGATALTRGERLTSLSSMSTPLSSVREPSPSDNPISVLLPATAGAPPSS